MNLSEAAPFTQKKHVFFFLLFIYQYMLMSANFYNLRIGPANLQITITTLLLIFCTYLINQKIIRLLGWQVILILYLGLMFIPLKILMGMMDISGIQGMRLFYMLPLFWALYNGYANDDKSKETVRKIIIWNCFFVAIFGIIHSFIYADQLHVNTWVDLIKRGLVGRVPGLKAEAAFFGNPSAYGCILVTGLFGLYLSGKKNIPEIVIFFTIFLSVFLSGSRWAALFSIIALIMFLKDNLKFRRRNIKYTFLTLIIASSFLYIMYYVLPNFLYAFLATYNKWGISSLVSGGDVNFFIEKIIGTRFPGYEVGLRILFSNLSYFLLGGTQWETFINNGIQFSDNSFIFLAIGYGVPLAILWILIVLLKMVPILPIKTASRFIMLIFLYGTIFSTPGLFWDPWLLYIMGILHCSNREPCLGGQREMDGGINRSDLVVLAGATLCEKSFACIRQRV